MAIGAMLAAEHLEMSVPDDVAVVGFDDIPMAAMIVPPLTTMRIPQYELGKLTGELLMKHLTEKDATSQALLYSADLQIRGSCGAKDFTKDQKRQLVENLISSFSVDLPDGLPVE
jgi:DNA-binding LacI/PurR family transcriptional regulator